MRQCLFKHKEFWMFNTISRQYEVVQVHFFNTALSTSGVERGFSAMNLTETPLRTNLNQANISRFMLISVNGPKRITDTK